MLQWTDECSSRSASWVVRYTTTAALLASTLPIRSYAFSSSSGIVSSFSQETRAPLEPIPCRGRRSSVANDFLSARASGTQSSMKVPLASAQVQMERTDFTVKTSINPAVLKSLDDEMQKVAKRQKKYEEELSDVQTKLEEANQKLESIETTKKKYLEGGSLGDLFGERQNFTETTLRSAIKAMMWRVIAGLITLATALRFSGSFSTALSIVGSDFFSKSFTMFIGERLMNKSQAGRDKGADDISRSLVKALIWRLFAICNTLTMSVFFAKDLKVASKIAGSDAVFKTALMFVYERVWARTEWGKQYQIEYAI